MTFLFVAFFGLLGFAQPETQIRGFADFGVNYKDEKATFILGEQDLFITADVSERVSFLGETVFKYSPNSPTRYDISIERIIMKLNIKGNHNILFGKHHTPVNYWNDSYHHGRVFFPTIFRPDMFTQGVVPLHTTGIRMQGQNLGKLRFGYDALIGNGVASTDITDFNIMKAFMLGVNMMPFDRFKVGLSYYYDDIPKGAVLHHSSNSSKRDVQQAIYSGYISYFGDKLEVLGESSVAVNGNDSTGYPISTTGYLYTGVRIKKKIVPYIRVDLLQFSPKEVLFMSSQQQSALVGLRYEINYLAVLKFEYGYSEQRREAAYVSSTNTFNFQFAVGF